MRSRPILLVAGLLAATVAVPVAQAHDGSSHLISVGFGAREITPAGPVPEAWADYFTVGPNGIWGEPFEDLDGDGCYDGATTANAENGDPAAEPHTDVLANQTGDAYLTGAFDVDGVTIVGDPQSAGKWDGLWAGAGFGSQCAEGVLEGDGTWARAVVLDDGDSPVALVSVDAVGLFNVEVQRLRRELAARYPEIAGAGLELVVASTHTHEAVDTMGYWGQTLGVDGKSPSYQAFIRSQVLDAVDEAWQARQEATARFAAVDHTVGIRDSRDPQVIDPVLDVARFAAADDGEVLGTVVTWSNHAEALGGDNGLISSDFADPIRDVLEAGGGGTGVFFAGSVGGLMTPLRADVPGWEGNDDLSVERMRTIGTLVAEAALDGIATAAEHHLTDVDVRVREIFVEADNTALNALNIAGVFDVPVFSGGDTWGPDPAAHRAGVYGGRAGSQFRTEMVRVALGAGGGDPVASFLTVPGELFPELELGFPEQEPCRDTGYPDEPVLDDHETAEFSFVLGLAQDELGYIVPRRDHWLLHADHQVTGPGNGDGLVPVGALQADDACGEGHYEETVSASSLLAPWVACVGAELAGHPEVWTEHPACSRANTTTTPLGLGGSVIDPAGG